MWHLLLTILLTQSPNAENQHFEAGIQALKTKDADAAVRHLSACVQQQPNHTGCLWELGWAYYLKSDWDNVVKSWEEVKKLAPDRVEIETHLDTAKKQLQLLAQLEATKNAAPQTVRTPPPEGASIRLRSVGDVMLGTNYPKGYLPPNKGADMLTGVADWMSDADLTFANLEGPLCDRGRSSKCAPDATNCYAFRTPTSYGKYLAEAGIDLVSTANNHAADFGRVCREDTHALLDQLGIAWSGPPGSIASVNKNGIQVGMIAFHTSPSSNHLNNTRTAKALIAAAASRNDVVIVSFHGGAEGNKALHVPDKRETFYGEDRGHLRQFARDAIDAGADIIIGHGPHVPRGMEIYKERLIAYSLGNFATYGRFGLSGNLSVGLVLETELDAEGRFVRGMILPTRQHSRGVPAKDDENRAIDLIRKLSLEDFPQTAPLIGQDGRFAPRTSE